MLLKPSEQIRWLVDCDSFFSSCEIYRQPKRQWRCVCVGNDIIVAASYEAKSYGVKTGTPVREAKRMLPRDAVFCRPDFRLYKHLSAQLMDYLHKRIGNVLPSSIDEAYLYLTDWTSIEQACSKIEQLKIDIKERVGIPVSIGCSSTKLLAKIFAKRHKPYGTATQLQQGSIQAILDQLPLEEVPYIGKKTLPKLHYLCQTAGQFAKLDYQYVKQLLHHPGIHIRAGLNGYQLPTRRTPRNQSKSISATRSFNTHFTSDQRTVRRYLMYNFERAYTTLINQQLVTRQVGVMLRTREFTKTTSKLKLPRATQAKSILIATLQELFGQLYDTTSYYRSTGIYLRELTPTHSAAVSLFDTTNQGVMHQQCHQLISELNRRRGKKLITSASAHRSPTHWPDIYLQSGR